MKRILEKTSGRIAVVVIAFLLIAVVGILALRGRKMAVDTSQVAGDTELAANESTESTEVAEQEETTTEATEEIEVAESSEETETTVTETEPSQPSTTENKKEVPATKPSQETSTATDVVPPVENLPESTAPTGNSGNNNTAGTPTTPAAPTTPVDPELAEVDKYYQENATLIRMFDASLSEDVHTEEEVIGFLEERGFTQYPITYDFAMGGEYNGETEITGDANEKRPMYQTYFKTENNEVWTIFVINGVIIANPASYNLESTLSAQLLISESEQLTSYNNKTNKYYVTIPKETTVIVKTVDRIDADSLNQLTCEEIDKL